MQGDENYTWAGDVIHTSEPEPYVATLRNDRPRNTLAVTIGNVDLPAFVSDGVLYIQAPLPHVFKAFAEDISDFIRDMEVRVSTAGGATLSLDRDGRPVSRSRMAKPSVVRRGGKR